MYGLLAVVISPAFFPSTNRATSVLIALGAFGSSYLARPVGGMFFGWLGDRHGRRPVLLATVLTMGLASGALGLLPAYRTIGVASPVLLLVLRLVQGFSAGGELAGATTYVVESIPRGRRSFFGAVVGSGGSVGFVVAAVAAGIMGAVLTPQQFADWGWRVLFLLCLPLALAALLIRTRLEESPEFASTLSRNAISKAPVREVLAKSWLALLRVIGIQIGCSAAGYVGLVYLAVYLVGTRNFPANDVYWISAVAIAMQAAVLPYFGSLGGRIGRRKVILGATAALLVLSYPMFLVFATARSLAVIAVVFCLFMVIEGAQASVSIVEFTLLFPVKYRYTGSALGYNVATAVAGGFSPFIAAQLIIWTGSRIAPSFWLIGVSALAIAVLATMGSAAPDQAVPSAGDAVLRDAAAGPPLEEA
jgi:MHS family proline/betaine transporter-like MFS transporter